MTKKEFKENIIIAATALFIAISVFFIKMIIPEYHCPNCKTKIEYEDNFCKKCGIELDTIYRYNAFTK